MAEGRDERALSPHQCRPSPRLPRLPSRRSGRGREAERGVLLASIRASAAWGRTRARPRDQPPAWIRTGEPSYQRSNWPRGQLAIHGSAQRAPPPQSPSSWPRSCGASCCPPSAWCRWNLLPGPWHWVIRTVHLLTGLVAM